MTVQRTVAGPAAVATVHHRRSVAKLTPAQLADLRQAFRAMMALDDERGFWYFAGWHGEPFNWCEHHTELVLPWHRAYLYSLEVAMRRGVATVSLPWWDWTTAAGIPRAYTAATADGQPNPLRVRRVRVYRSGRNQRAPARQPGKALGIPPLPMTRFSSPTTR